MKKNYLCIVAALIVGVSALHAQDTIDTSYYRYGKGYFRDEDGWDVGGNTGYGNYIPYLRTIWQAVCPNGVGFDKVMYWKFDSPIWSSLDDALNDGEPFAYDILERQNGYLYNGGGASPEKVYWVYSLNTERQTVYGIAFAIDTVANLTEGDSMTAILYTLADDHNRLFALDSITIKGGERGKRRWMEVPVLKNELAENNIDMNTEPMADCIDTVMYRQLIELYFDNGRSYSVNNRLLFWQLRISVPNGSVFCGSLATHPYVFIPFVFFENEVMTRWGFCPSTMDFLYPILSPLPEWEVPGMTQVIPDAQKPQTPADPHDPEDPRDPDDPADPGNNESIQSPDLFGLHVAPNPASECAVVSCTLPINELTLRDINGCPMITLHNCGVSVSIDTSNLPSGLYLLNVMTSAGSAVRKLLVQ